MLRGKKRNKNKNNKISSKIHREEKDWIRHCSAITIVLMLDDCGFYVIVLWSGHSGSYDRLKKIIILERTILYEFCTHFM
jgi:hypothetical protein